jgi:cytochrome c6
MLTTVSRLALVTLASTALFAAPAAFAADGAALYKANCAGCHGADGKADTSAAKAMKVPALAGKNLDVDTVLKAIKTNPKHKSLAKKLSDDDIKAIAAALPK